MVMMHCWVQCDALLLQDETGGGAMQTQQTEIAGQKAVQELAAAKKTYLQKIVAWKLPEAQAKDVVFIVHTQLRRKQRRFQSFFVSIPWPYFVHAL